MVEIEVHSLRKEFPVPQGKEIAVSDIDLTIDDGEFVSIVGPSGCGKTTTLRCIAGLESPTSGKILFDNTAVTDMPANKRNIAMMFQNIALYPHMNIIDNIAYPLKVRNVPKKERYDQARDAAELMKIPELLDKYPSELSGGQQQRAALARTLVQEPIAFLMDEPLSDLDAKLKIDMRKEMQKIHKKVQIPTIYVTHDQEEAMTMSDKIIVMNDGKIEQAGTPNELYNQPNNIFVGEFIGTPSINYLTGSVERRNGKAMLNTSLGEIDVSQEYIQEVSEGEEIIVGIRPESITPSLTNGDISIKCMLVERISDRFQFTLDGEESGEITAVTSAEKDWPEDEEIFISIDGSDILLFDKDTRELIPKKNKN